MAMGVFGLDEFAPLGDRRLALATAILISIWRNIGFPTLVFLAGMNAIPEEIFKAAELDGASDWQVFPPHHAAQPRASISIVVILSFIGAFGGSELPSSSVAPPAIRPMPWTPWR